MAEVNFVIKKGLTVPKGSASTPAIIFDASDPNTGIYSPAADELAISTNGTGRLFVDASGNVGVGTASPSSLLDLENDGPLGIRLKRIGANPSSCSINNAGNLLVLSHNVSGIQFDTGSTPTERARIDGSGRLLVGTSSTSIASALLTLQSNSPHLYIQKSSLPASGNAIGGLRFADNSNNLGANLEAWADGSWTSGSSHPTRLVFSTTADGASIPTERVRINSDKSIRVNGIYHLVESRSYTASTSATDVFVLTTTGTHGAATFKWTFVDTSFEEGARVGTMDLAWQRVGLSASTTGINDTTNASATRGTFTGISWSVSSKSTNSITLAVTGTTTSGAGTLYIWCESPYISKIVDA